jgi:hypothetical protein
LFSFQFCRLCAAEKIKANSRAQKSVEQRNKSEARRLKAHYGRLKESIREAGRNAAHKAARRSPSTATQLRKKSNQSDFRAKSKPQSPEREVKFDFDLKSAPELRAQVVNLNPAF